MRVLKKESDKLIASKFELNRRRLNWRLVVQEKVENYLNSISKQAKLQGYPFNLYCYVNDETDNEYTVQLTSSKNKTGVIERIDTPECKGGTCEIEKGSALVVSFNSTGRVAIIIYPYKSERYSLKEDNIILYQNISPDEISNKLLKKCISKYFMYIRYSSVHGSYCCSFLDHLRVQWMNIIDIRNRHKLLSSFYSISGEWLKIIGAGIAGYIVALAVQST
ncbi:hypothetical protein GUM57_24650 [Vibrio parahaemolyticus]|nr:hypothetical protein [Vibrio parahaemolyticus]